ncbi:hypothetical protein [Chitinophaga sancti]|uniref:Alkylhydroperoxidase AhpD family core domain-containing protein n=1 Tax=Chitinophaga sancti TaxID=1004 RepID=A0A1K1SNE3_9BACT|nr:hypothetical protein [Chitinophaga sancti]WQD63919.1 hypothetical protein U0033_05885 [Chitinophaga sancti]WQG90456.1 hypothetical protein SR876_03035 [Chitinophaga sancti]SFW85413.1 alkylhydroperoxidase AhpD family core domain-containing protein [Chitinophaga sancti]
MYVFNQARKRLEPTETKCQYCETGHSSDMEDNYFINLFKEQDRTNIIVYRSVKYQKIPVGISRCKDCLNAHESAAKKAGIICVAVAIAMEIIFFKIDLLLGLIGLVPFFLIIFAGTGYLANRFVEDKGVTPKVDGAKNNEAVQHLLMSGWSLTQPSA